MKPKMFENKPESPKNISITPPAVELFLNPTPPTATWPEKLSHNKEFLKQIEDRRKLSDRLNAVIAACPRPDISLQQALAENLLTEKQVTDLYSSLIDLIDDTDYQRIILYLPFEFLPNPAWQPASTELQQTAEKFRAVYLKAWHNLLTIHDVRANFVDGDVLDLESRVEDLPRVVKAAHLVPKLIQTNLLKTDDVLKLLETTNDPILKESLSQGLTALSAESAIKKTNPNQPTETSLSLIEEKLQEEFKNIEAEKYSGLTNKRVAWLKQQKKQQTLNSISDNISQAIINQALPEAEMIKFLEPEASLDCQSTLIGGLAKAIEATAATNIEAAKSLFSKHRDLLLSFWKNNQPETRPILTKTFCHFQALGLITKQELASLGIAIPALAGPFSENLKPMKEELSRLENIINLIKTNPELSKYLYPVILIFGSRLKGYGGQNADLDLSVLVKPDAPTDDLDQIQALIKKTFSQEKTIGEIIEFWLEKDGDNLQVRDLENSNTLLGESYWTHVLFGAIWQGDPNTIRELREKLLVPYLSETKKIIHGRKARGLYLEELERDTLQYRLMHRGYEQFFPSRGGLKTPNSDQVDGQSMFWDSGYRQTATKLFVSRVFLPKV